MVVAAGAAVVVAGVELFSPQPETQSAIAIAIINDRDFFILFSPFYVLMSFLTA